jgi:hypothetical protein
MATTEVMVSVIWAVLVTTVSDAEVLTSKQANNFELSRLDLVKLA